MKARALFMGTTSRSLAAILHTKGWNITVSPQDTASFEKANIQPDEVLEDIAEAMHLFEGGKAPEFLSIELEDLPAPQDATDENRLRLRMRRNILRLAAARLVLLNGGYVITDKESANEFEEGLKRSDTDRKELQKQLKARALYEIRKAEEAFEKAQAALENSESPQVAAAA